MFDPKKLLDDLLGSKVPGTQSTIREQAGKATQMAKDNPLAAGALVAVLLGTGTGRQVTGTALKLGGLAAIGGLAYKAYQNYKNGDQPQQANAPGQPELLPPPSDTGFHPSQAPQGETEFALMLIRAMISAAKADGQVDQAEMQKIAGKIGDDGVTAEEKAFVMSELAAPVDIDALAAEARGPAQAAEVYAASLIAIDIDSEAERAYLRRLADALRLDPATVAQLHQMTGAPAA